MKKKKRVLVIRCGLLGDTVDATSVIEPLIDYFGKNLEIFWVSRPGICDLFKYDKRIKGPNYKWASLSQIKKLALKNRYVNPFVKTILFIL